jgi:hypothetical protein
MSAKPADIMLSNHGSVWLVTPVTDAAREWIDDNVAADAQYFAGSLVVEPRYIAGIVRGMEEDGFTVA